MPRKPPNRTDHEQELINLMGRRMRRARILNELTHEKLAEKCGISLRNIQAMQSGLNNIRFTTLARIKKALKLKTWEELLPEWDDVEVKKKPRRKAAKKAVKKAVEKKVKKAVKRAVKKAARKTVKKAIRAATKSAAKKPSRKSRGGSGKK